MPPFGRQFKALIAPTRLRPWRVCSRRGASAGVAVGASMAAGVASAVTAGAALGTRRSGGGSAVAGGGSDTPTCGADSGSASGLSKVDLASAKALSPSAMPSWMCCLICLVGSSDCRSSPPAAPSSCFFTSSSSDWRTISSTWPRNSDAMPRIWDIHLPQVRSRPGSSFGPMTTSATTAMTSSSGLSMPNMDHRSLSAPPQTLAVLS